MAVTLTDPDLAAALAVNDALASRLRSVAVALVERYAPDAPEAVQNEAAIRCAGWLAEQPAAGVRSMRTGGGCYRLRYVPLARGASPLRSYGAPIRLEGPARGSGLKYADVRNPALSEHRY